MTKSRVLVASWATLLLFVSSHELVAGGSCTQCGCKDGGCETVCRLVKSEKVIEVTCWACKCEEICIPGRSYRECKNCETVCSDCGQSAGEKHVSAAMQAKPKNVVWYSWIPGCAKSKSRKKLYRKVEKITVPSYKWVVEHLCDKCESKVEVAPIEPGTNLPAPPEIDARLLYRRHTEPR